MDLGDERAGRWRGRFRRDGVGALGRRWQAIRDDASVEFEIRLSGEELASRGLIGEGGFFLGFPGGGDCFAHAAGVLAVEGVRDDGGDGFGSGAIQEHGSPGDGLQCGPFHASEGEHETDDEESVEGRPHAGCF
jgi:hypothetical protein